MTSSPSALVNLFFTVRTATAPPAPALPLVTPPAVPTLVLQSVATDGGHRDVEIGRSTASDVAAGDSRWKFTAPIAVQFFFELRQDFRATVQLSSPDKRSLVDFRSSVEFQLAKVVAAKDRVLALPLPGGRVLDVTAVQVSSDARDVITLQFTGTGVTKSPAYIQLFRVEPSGDETLLWQSAAVSGEHPRFAKTKSFELHELTSADTRHRNLRIACVHKGWFSESAMGSVLCSFRDLESASDAATNALFLEKVKRDGRVKRYGALGVFLKRVHVPTFTEYLQSGYEMNLVVSIDCTASNGEPSKPTSLHYMGGAAPNQYLRAIRSVGDVLMQYDTDKLVPVLGFGAKLPKQASVSHFFHVNLSADPYVYGVEGIVQAYQACIPKLTFNGPTNFAPTIRSVTEGARRAKNVYTMLLIITDGEITDLADTTDALVEADDAPLSIVITGVGHACDFENMVYLDGDGTFLKHSSGRVSRRDLVQFVPFRDFERAPPATLAAEVLRELPDQFVDWARLAKVSPLGATAAPSYTTRRDSQ